jgi:hypothetical protein
VRLTDRGQELRGIVSDLFERHATGLIDKAVIGPDDLDRINAVLKRLERYWTDQIRYIY